MFMVALCTRRPAGPKALEAVLEVIREDIASQETLENGDTLIQLVNPEAVLALIEASARHQGVCVGIGADSGEGRARNTPVDYANRALRRARSRSGDMPVVIMGRAIESAQWATNVAQLVFFSLARRSEPGWEVAELVARGATQKEAAAELGITEQAVSQRLRAAGYRETRNIQPLLLCLLEQSGRTPTR
ncbi:MAG: hypothetical protein Q4B12_01025 [Bowdeniella nasicola]|nr:hypothetical protein [Bowdeniella nasicola]